MCLIGLVQLLGSALDGGGVRLIPELVPQAHGHAPVRHGAFRVLLLYLEKSFFRFLVPERVQQGDTFFESLLSVGCARDGEMYGAQLLSCDFVVMAFIRER